MVSLNYFWEYPSNIAIIKLPITCTHKHILYWIIITVEFFTHYSGGYMALLSIAKKPDVFKVLVM